MLAAPEAAAWAAHPASRAGKLEKRSKPLQFDRCVARTEPIPWLWPGKMGSKHEERGVREASRMTPEASTNKTTGEGSRLKCGLVSYRPLASFLHAGKKSVQDVLL